MRYDYPDFGTTIDDTEQTSYPGIMFIMYSYNKLAIRKYIDNCVIHKCRYTGFKTTRTLRSYVVLGRITSHMMSMFVFLQLYVTYCVYY